MSPMSVRRARHARVGATLVALSALVAGPASAPADAAPAPVTSARVLASLPRDARSASFTDAAGTRSTYHLFTAGLRTTRPQGLVVYLDGDGMYGHDHPTSSWALGGRRGVVAQAAARGYATLSIRTPDRRGTPTFWENGKVNAAYVAALTRNVSARLGVSRVWFVGYSGGSQLITRYLLPAHGARFTQGGAVITGGGGRPPGRPAMPVRSSFPLIWYTGSLDDGRGSDDGYNALADAKRGAAWYRARGANATRIQPAGLDHSDLGTRFGTVLAQQLDARAR